jgi:DNA-binding MarR family transcriptional regulator
MTSSTHKEPGPADAERTAALEELRLTMSSFFAAQRRLRGRDARIQGGVSFAHYPLLGALAREGDLSAGALAAEAGITPATVTQMVDTLSAAGLVERTRSDRDRRVVTIRLTDEGRRRHGRKEAELLDKWRAALSDFEPGELEAANRIVARLGAYLDGL